MRANTVLPVNTIDEIRRANLRRWVSEVGGKQAELARRINKSANQVSQWLGLGKPRNISSDLAREIEATGGKPHGWLDQRHDDAAPSLPNDEEFSVVPGFAAAIGLSDGEEALDYASTHGLKFRKDSLRRKHLLGADLAVMYGKGDSMEPLIQTGDAILFNRDNRTPKHEELYVVQLPGVTLHDRISVKQAELVGSIVTFRALNPEGDHHWRRPRLMDDPRSPITVIGRVCWLGKWT